MKPCPSQTTERVDSHVAIPRSQQECSPSQEPENPDEAASQEDDSDQGSGSYGMLKRLASRLPHKWQTELKRHHFGRQISKGRFVTDEPEYEMLESMVKPGDWVVDIGANVGHYTKKLSELVGPSGRVLAFEPVPTTFSLLSANTQLFPHANVSLFNAAVSDKLDLVGMSMPKFESGLDNYYEAHLSGDSDSNTSVLTISVDELLKDRPVSLVKIDAEGHEAFVLEGMKQLIRKHHPVLVLETEDAAVVSQLEGAGYQSERIEGSPNTIFRPAELTLPT